MINPNPEEEIYDIIVVGIGIYGSSILYHASKNIKQKVLGLEQFELYNEKGSSFGETRITRQHSFEGPVYSKIAKEAQDVIQKLEKESGQTLQKFNGGLYLGPMDCELIQSYFEQQKAKKNDQKTEIMTSQEVYDKYKVFKMPEEYVGLLEDTAGYALIDKIKAQFLEIAEKSKNITIKTKTKIQKYDQKKDYIEVKAIVQGQKNELCFKTRKLILSQGIGMVPILKDLGVPIKIQKNQAIWLDWDDKEVLEDNLPIFLIQYKGDSIYGFPNVGTGFKMALHQQGTVYESEDDVDYKYCEKLLQKIKSKTSEFIPNIDWDNRKISAIRPCCYTMTEDHNFVLDFHPENKNVVLVSCCSGHGYKYAAQLGLKILEMTQTQQIPYKEFQISRFDSK